VCLLGLVSGVAFAQSTDASLTGTVTDSTGAAVPGAAVLAENTATGVVSRAETNDQGVFNFPALRPGPYRLTVERQGFRKTTINDVQLEVGARLAKDVQLEVGALAETVEVSAANENQLNYVTSSVGGMVTGQKVLDLPITSRNALELVTLQAGVVGSNFVGTRIGNLNIQMDGINVQDARINLGVASTVFASVDRVEEFRVITQPVDAELGRGSGQIQLITRSGTNNFRGSVFNNHRNTVLNANTFFNNLLGTDRRTGQPVAPRETLIRNQFGARVGGPVIKNRTFFHFLYEGQRLRGKDTINATVLTAPARQGNFRFFPGAQNGNVNATNPTVNLDGTPLRPPAATGDLQTVSLFGRDPNRLTADPTGTVQRLIGITPLPNNFLIGDGLNTAGFSWNRPYTDDLNQYTIKIDHLFNAKHRISGSYNLERADALNGFIPQLFPDAPGGTVYQKDELYQATLTSTITPNLVNEFRFGALRPKFRFFAPWELGDSKGGLPVAGSTPYGVDFPTITDPLNLENDPQGRISPNYQWFNKVSWLKGKHNIKFGGQMWFVSTNGFNSFTVLPRANVGSGGAPVQNITNGNAIPAIGANGTIATNILNILNGSLASVQQALNSPGGPNPQFLAGEGKQRTWRAREFGIFFQDDWKIRQNLTINLGMRYEWYGVPWEANGKTAALANGSAGIFGLSGTDFGSMFRPGVLTGSLTEIILVGRNSTNPNRLLYNNDWNNIAPVVGVSWSPDFLGKNKTVLRAGYSMGYERFSLRILDVVSGDQPGLRQVQNFVRSTKIDLRDVALPLAPSGRPLELIPLTDRLLTVRSYDTGLRTPYVQNFNFTIDRELPGKLVASFRYVGNKGTRLIRGASVNEANIFENGILEAFQITQAGGNAPLFDRLLNGINIGSGRIVGVNVTGSQALREFNATTQGHFANNNVGTFAAFLNNTNQYTGVNGGLLRNGAFPENWIMTNPQFNIARLTSNYGSSTYHSFQAELTGRFRGLTVQSNYTLSKALGEEEGSGQEQNDEFRTHRNRRLDKRLLAFHRTHVVRNNFIYELPFGKGKAFLSGGNGFVNRVFGGWQIGAIYNVFSGQPISVGTTVNSFNNFGSESVASGNTPVVTGPIPKSLGKATVTGNGVVYFPGIQSIIDPSVATMAASLRGVSTLRAVADANGNVLFRNPLPGELGNLSPRFLTGPGSFRLDANLIKNIAITERISLQISAQADNVTNTPQWGNPNLDINSLNFGRITSAGGTRIVVLTGRINF
jgi:hypothetical protein